MTVRVNLPELLEVPASNLMYWIRSFVDSPIHVRSNEPEQIFESNHLWFASPETLNDPLECRPNIVFSKDGNLSPKQIRALAESQGKNLSYANRLNLYQRLKHNYAMPETRQKAMISVSHWLANLFLGSSLCCFLSELTTPLWASYGNDHAGYALVFKRGAIFKFDIPNKHFYQTGIGNFHAVEVDYVKDYPVIDGDGDWENMEIIDILRTGLLTKHESWANERELRVMRPGVSASPQLFESDNLVAVIFGEKISPLNRKRLVSLASKLSPSIKLIQTSYRSGTFNPNYQPV